MKTKVVCLYCRRENDYPGDPLDEWACGGCGTFSLAYQKVSTKDPPNDSRPLFFGLICSIIGGIIGGFPGAVLGFLIGFIVGKIPY